MERPAPAGLFFCDPKVPWVATCAFNGSAILPVVAPFSRRLRRIEAPRLAAIGLTVALLAIFVAYGYALTAGPASAAGVVAAAALVGIAGIGLLYAWRAVTGASFD